MNIKEQLNDLRKAKKSIIFSKELIDYSYIFKIQNAKTQEEKQNIIAKNNFEKKEIYKKIDVYNEKIDECLNNIENYSMFESSIIIPVIKNLVSIFEGENFISQYTCHKCGNSLKNITIIVSESNSKELYYDERYLYSLVKNGNAIILGNEEYCNNVIKFYKSDSMHRINQCVNFKNFSYVKEFIDFLINFKFEKNLVNLSEEIIKCLEAEFIKSKLEEIKINYDKKDEECKIKMEQQINHENKIRERQLKKVLRRI